MQQFPPGSRTDFLEWPRMRVDAPVDADQMRAIGGRHRAAPFAGLGGVDPGHETLTEGLRHVRPREVREVEARHERTTALRGIRRSVVQRLAQIFQLRKIGTGLEIDMTERELRLG